MFIEEDVSMESFWIHVALSALKSFSFVYDVITFPIYLILQRPWKTRVMSRRAKAKIVNMDDTQITYRSLTQPKETHIKLLQEKIDTLEKMFKYVVKIHTTKRCLGTREILGEEDEVQDNGRIFKKYKLGEYKWRNYLETESQATYFGRGIREVGVKSRENVVVFAETRAEWMIAAHGLFKHSCPIVTIYATLGEEGITHGITETEVNTVVTSHELLPKLRNILPTIPKVNTIIFFEDQLHKTDTSGFGNIRVIPFSQVLKMGVDSKIDETPPSTDDVAIIMYTSGSTGTPKGVLLTHANCLGTMKSFCDAMPIYSEDVLIGFLPLAHVFELIAESVCLLSGVPIGYSTPNTLIDSSTKIMKGCKGDATILKPTCMTTVPLILDRISKGINDKVNKGSALQKVIFKFAYNYKAKWHRRGYKTPFLDRLIFKKIARLMGGNVRLLVSGGAPLSADTHEQIRLCLCVDMCQGYGLTETTAGAAVMDRYDMSYGRVGAPTSINDIKLINWEEGNYRVTNKPYPQGEIVMGGENVSIGYYKLPGKTAEEFFEQDGLRWFRTGDIGEIHPDGVLKIIDRKKDLVKLQAGEYVSLGKVETEMKTCSLVENVCVYGDPSKTYCVALVVPVEKVLMELATSLGITGDFEELCSNSVIEKAVLKELAEHAKKSRLQKYEIPAAITLCKDVWSPDMGLVTAAFKIKRKDIQERYKAEINRMYAS
ncbi:CLUMA_CG013541, isoform A [Clunio marinus]|uniref:long-chain-fatty-acid--CoA ligase n=1 Tax=Clunio marinus TaxID=568069 RepID=A0A1J1IL34_9DIPT|nr:CLUMA_CG013541, isoform A [Clunio marinus]